MTYLGGSEVAEPRTIVNEANRQIRRLELMGKTGSMIEVSYPVLNKAVRTPPKGADDTTDAVEKYIPKHFSAAESGCGLIELTDYDVWPLPRQGTSFCI